MLETRWSALSERTRDAVAHDGWPRGLLRAVGRELWEFIGAALLYLGCELLIWALSQAFRSVSIKFPASVIGMILVFLVMCALQIVWSGVGDVYDRCIKSKVNFINNNIGVGFPVPIIMVSKGQILDATDIGRVIGTFVDTNVIFWPSVFFISWAVLAVVLRRRHINKSKGTDTEKQWSSTWLPEPTFVDLPTITFDLAPPSSRRTSETLTVGGLPDSALHSNRSTLMGSPEPQKTRTPRKKPASEASVEGDKIRNSTTLHFVANNYPVILSLFCALTIGIPAAVKGGEDRILDGCFLWFVWITAVRLQSGFKNYSLLKQLPKSKAVLATLLNPVMWTAFGMIAYIRAKAGIVRDLAHVLAIFSSGTPLSDIWTAHITSQPLKPSEPDWFGAGDAALSILESGIVAWGFKLFECRRELWSRAGGVVVILSFASAISSVFVSVLLGRAVGLAQPESLAFAARSTTLALARPAMQALGANEVVNAAVVVCNGILGQLMYPYLLERLDIPDWKSGKEKQGQEEGDDSVITIAAGTMVGINGAAMGVSYLYERRSHGAPYAALSMTVFGVMTVVFTSAQPFNHIVRNLALS